jgi:hypothetical protein
MSGQNAQAKKLDDSQMLQLNYAKFSSRKLSSLQKDIFRVPEQRSFACCLWVIVNSCNNWYNLPDITCWYRVVFFLRKYQHQWNSHNIPKDTQSYPLQRSLLPFWDTIPWQWVLPRDYRLYARC